MLELEKINALITMDTTDKLFSNERRIYELEMDYKILKKDLEERLDLLEQMFEIVTGSTFTGEKVHVMKAKKERILKEKAC